jgi:hypothetical protein
MHKITLEELSELNLGDKRRNDRFIKILNNLIAQPGSSIPKQSKNWYETKATYEFYKNENITLEKIQEAVHSYGKQSALSQEPDMLLIPHDTCNIGYTELCAEGLGYLDHGYGRGILLHNSIAVSPLGYPLTILSQQLWTRDPKDLGKGKNRKATAFEDKESYKWYKGIQAVNELLGKSIKKIHIADREADIYDLFFMDPEDNSELLIRACHKRKTISNNDLWDEIESLPVSAVITLTVPDSTGKKKQSIKAEVRYNEVEILQPISGKHKYKSVKLTAIEVRQQGIKNEENGVCWKLFTTIGINHIDDVKQCILWYTYRWLIERFHYTLKSGCQIEALQLKQAESLKKAIVTYSLAAFKIMQLTYQSRETPEVSCEVILDKTEWEALYVYVHKTATLPVVPPTLQQAAKWIGRLGGHLGRKSDGPPGLKTIWRGYQRLRDYAEIYALIKAKENLGKA